MSDEVSVRTRRRSSFYYSSAEVKRQRGIGAAPNAPAHVGETRALMDRK
jgi:hypothetical protein